MKKNKKYILFVIVIILIIFSIVFLVLSGENSLRKAYKIEWYIYKFEIYDGNELLHYVDLSNGSYIYLTKDNINYCRQFGADCKKHKYTYDGDTIVTMVDHILPKGEYKIDLSEENVLKLEKEVNKKRVVYCFAPSVG